MRPAGARSRGQPPPARPGASRSEAFENIFGRPAVGHHLGNAPNPAHAGGAGATAGGSSLAAPHAHSHPHPQQSAPYGAYNPAQRQSAPGHGPAPGPYYNNPAQPSLPPVHGGLVAPPPRSVSHSYAQTYAAQQSSQSSSTGHGSYPQQRHEGSSSGHPRPAPPPSAYPGQAPELGGRRGSTQSTASYYSPQPDAPSPSFPQTARMPSAGATGFSSRQLDFDQRPARPPIQTTNLSAPLAPSPYDGISPVSSVFPPRTSSAAANASSSSLSLPSSASSARPGPPLLGAVERSQRSPPAAADSTERLMSPPPDYLRSMENLSFDGSGRGPLDDVPGIPRRGEAASDLGDFGTWSRSDEHLSSGRTSSHSARTSDPRQTYASSRSFSTHSRMPSDSSVASSGYTMTSRNHMTPLSQIEQSPAQTRDPARDSPTTPTGGSDAGFAAHAARRLSGRKSMESARSIPYGSHESSLPPGAAPSAVDGRATSFSGSTSSRKEAVAVMRSGSIGNNLPRRPASNANSIHGGLPSPHASQVSLSGTLTRTSSKRAAQLLSMPNIHPALLSRVAEAFKQLITLAELTKDGITYKDAFDGRMAVAIIAEIIKTPDRNLALLLGRALDAQKFFHDVTYDHRLRDNPSEIYQFNERLAAPFIRDPAAAESPSSEQGTPTAPRIPQYTSDSIQTSESMASESGASSFFASPGAISTPMASSSSLPFSSNSTSVLAKVNSATGGPLNDEALDTEDDLPVGVFTLLTDCYSPTCSRDSLCYSINCPRRLEQMKRLNMKPQPGLTRKLSQESLHDVKETGTLWIHSVSQEILDSVDDTEKKRQEAINEVIYTERDFVRDLEYLRDSWIKPLRTQDVIPGDRRNEFVQQVFWNVHDVLSVNTPLAERLTKRQKQQPVVKQIGDIFLDIVPQFEPFVQYGSHQLFGKYEFEKEKGANPDFQKFVDETERKPESRKLELNGYLTKPTTRLGRYPLLLEAVLKYTPDDNQDKQDLAAVIKMIRAFLTKVNEASGKAENVFELAQIESQLVFRPNETIDLRLKDKSRELVHKGPLKRRGAHRDEIADLTGFLFDHALLLVKPKHVAKGEQLRVYRRPIPLELLVVITPDEQYNSGKLSTGRGKLISRPSANSSKNAPPGQHVPPKPESKHGFSITIVHLGKKGYSLVLWVDTYVGRKKWLEAIDKQQSILRERSCVFVTESITEGYFGGLRKITCLSPYDSGHRVIYGTDEGVYFSNLRDEKLREPVKVINLLDVTQVDVIEEFQLLIVLHERSVTTFPLDCLDPNDPNAALKRGKRISSHTSFFKSGICLGKILVAVVKSSTLSSTIKVLEPIDQSMRGKKPQTSFMKRLNGGNEALKLFKEFYIPTESSSIHFLKTKLCVGCTKGFEIVDLETLDMQGLLDPSDSSLDFVLKRDNVRPIAIYRIEEDFLLCYDEFAFYVNKNGWRSRPKWAIVWEGVPTAFALQYPYVIAFEPTFVEVHHVETGHLVQIIPGNNIQCLFADTPPSRINAPVPPPSRPMMFSQGGYRPSPYAQQQHGHPSYAPPGQQGFPPMRGGHPMGYGGMPAPPVPAPNRFIRNQVIFTSDDGHVQFLKFPPPTASGSSSGSGAVSVSGSGSGSGSSLGNVGNVGGSPLPPLPPLPHARASPHIHAQQRMSH